MIGYDTLALNDSLLFSLPMREGTGSATVLDQAKAHHPVMQVGPPAWTQLPSGLWMMVLTNDYLSCAAASCADLNFTSGDFSAVCWMYKVFNGNYCFMSRTGADWAGLGTADGWQWMSHSGGMILRTYQPGVVQGTLGGIPGISIWWLVGFSRSGASVRMYRNGADDTVTPAVHINPTTAVRNLIIGADNPTTLYFNGSIWNPRIWGRSLAAKEHKMIFDMERHLFGV
jgi:hypothetical protein